MRPCFSHSMPWVRTGLAVCFAWSLLLTSKLCAQTQEQSNSEHSQTNQSSGKTPPPGKKPKALQFNPSAAAFVNTPRSIESIGLNNEDVEKAGSGSTPSEKQNRRGEIVVAPFPISNPALGSGLVLVGGYLFPLSKKDEISPNSIVGGGSFYTSNGSWLWGAGTKLYLMQDRLRLTAFYGEGVKLRSFPFGTVVRLEVPVS